MPKQIFDTTKEQLILHTPDLTNLLNVV